MRVYRMLVLAASLSGTVLTAGAQRRIPIEQPPSKQAAIRQNETTVRRVFEELFTKARYENINQVFDPHCKVHFGNRTVGLAQAVAEGKGWKSASPDMIMRAEEVTTNGDKVSVIWSANGTHTHEGIGLKPTGKRVSMRDRSEFLLKNGKIVEVWNNEYRPEIFRQLGVSKAGISMFDATERIWATISQILPDPLYASLQ